MSNSPSDTGTPIDTIEYPIGKIDFLSHEPVWLLLLPTAGGGTQIAATVTSYFVKQLQNMTPHTKYLFGCPIESYDNLSDYQKAALKPGDVILQSLLPHKSIYANVTFTSRVTYQPNIIVSLNPFEDEIGLAYNYKVDQFSGKPYQTFTNIHWYEFGLFCRRNDLVENPDTYHWFMSASRGILFPFELQTIPNAHAFLGIHKPDSFPVRIKHGLLLTTLLPWKRTLVSYENDPIPLLANPYISPYWFAADHSLNFTDISKFTRYRENLRDYIDKQFYKNYQNEKNVPAHLLNLYGAYHKLKASATSPTCRTLDDPNLKTEWDDLKQVNPALNNIDSSVILEDSKGSYKIFNSSHPSFKTSFFRRKLSAFLPYFSFITIFAFLTILLSLLPQAKAIDNLQPDINGHYLRNQFLYQPLTHPIQINSDLLHFTRTIDTSLIFTALDSLQKLQASFGRVCGTTASDFEFNTPTENKGLVRSTSGDFLILHGAHTYSEAKFACHSLGADIAFTPHNHTQDELFRLMTSQRFTRIWAGIEAEPTNNEFVYPTGRNIFDPPSPYYRFHKANDLTKMCPGGPEWDDNILYYTSKTFRYTFVYHASDNKLLLCAKPLTSDTQSDTRVADEFKHHVICMRKTTNIDEFGVNQFRKELCATHSINMQNTVNRLKQTIPNPYPVYSSHKITEDNLSLESYHPLLFSPNNIREYRSTRYKRALPLLIFKGMVGTASIITSIIEAIIALKKLPQNDKRRAIAQSLVDEIPALPSLKNLTLFTSNAAIAEQLLDKTDALRTVVVLSWLQAEMIATFDSLALTITNTHDFIINIITNNQRGSHFPGITQDDLKSAAKQLQLKTGLTLSTDLNSVSVSTTFAIDNTRVIVFSVPLIHQDDLATIFQVIPVPIFTNATTFMPNTNVKYIAAFIHHDTFTILSEREVTHCLDSPLCTAASPVYGKKSNVCGGSTFFYSSTATCSLKDLAHENSFIYNSQNITFFKVTNHTEIFVNCRDSSVARPGVDKKFTFSGFGAISIEPTCSLQIGDTVVIPIQQVNPYMLSPSSNSYTIHHLFPNSAKGKSSVSTVTEIQAYSNAKQTNLTLIYIIVGFVLVVLASVITLAIIYTYCLYSKGKLLFKFVPNLDTLPNLNTFRVQSPRNYSFQDINDIQELSVLPRTEEIETINANPTVTVARQSSLSSARTRSRPPSLVA